MGSRKRSHNNSSELKNNSSCSKRLRGSDVNNSKIVNYDPIIRSGKIRLLLLENFMCHEKLRFEFHNRINFIIGRNGSGKSAIMTAISLVLGGNARSTNRSTSIQNFIKTGENATKIEIELENSGPMAYKSEVYGNKITIIRTIRHTGASSYILKDCRGNVKSSKLDDLRQMMMFFSIRIENPIFMLNQDKAREFLRELEPKKNFELFMKAAQFDLMIKRLDSCQQMFHEHNSRYNDVITEIDIERNEIVEMEHKLELSKDVESMKERIHKMEISYAWCSVVAIENEINQMEEIIGKIEEKSKSLIKNVSTKEKLTETLKQQLNEKNKSLAQLQDAINEGDKSLHKVKDEVNRLNDQLRILQSNISSHMKRIDYEKVELRQLDTHMQNIDDNKKKTVELVETNKKKIQNLIEKLSDQKIMLENAKRDLVTMRKNLEQMRENKSEIKQETDNILKQINNITGNLSTLKVNTEQKLAIYGRNIVALVADIEKMYSQGKFSEMPRGPVGSYIKIPNEKFRNIVEHVIKTRLRSFIVNSNKDRFTLNELIKNKHPHVKSAVITTPFTKQVYNVAKGRVYPPPNTTLLMDEINCSDPVVMNLLIDTIRIETILITDSKDIAEELTAYIENVPRNLSRVIVPQWGLEYVAAPHYAMYSQRIVKASLLQVDVHDRIKQLTIEKNDAEKKGNIAQKSLQEITRNLQDQEMKCGEKRSVIASKENSIRQILSEKEELENFVYPHVPDLVILQNEYKEKEKKIEDINEKLNNDKTKLEEISSEKDGKVHIIENLEKTLQEHEHKREQQKEECDNVQLELRNVDYTVKNYDRKLTSMKDLLKTKEKELQEMKKKYEKQKSLALTKGEYIATERTDEELMNDIKTLKAKIQRYENLGIDTEQLAIAMQTKKKRIEVKDHDLKRIKETMESLASSYTNRHQVMNRLMRQAASFVRCVFQTVCRYRNMEGNLRIEFENKTLYVDVTPSGIQKQEGDNRLSMTSVLSGGERSFTTVALLRALWSLTNHPFYFLDEYDVFTDEVFRHYITKVLIKEGEKNPNRQYFFLTPQDTTIEKSDAIKIHKLAAPIRN